eukprot:2515252-Prymnesium_polylepis.1
MIDAKANISVPSHQSRGFFSRLSAVILERATAWMLLPRLMPAEPGVRGDVEEAPAIRTLSLCWWGVVAAVH